MRRVRFAAMGLLACGVMASAWAWDPGSGVTLEVRLEGEYNDNRDGTESATEDTFNFKLQPRAAFAYDFGLTYIDLFYMPYFLTRSDARDDQNDTEFYHELGANLRHEITPGLTFRISERFSMTDDPRVTEGGTTVRESATYNRNVLGIGLDIDVDPMTMLAVGGRSEIKRHDRREWRNYDEDKWGADVVLRREMGAMMNGLARFNYTKSEFSGEIDRGAEYIFLGVGVEKTFSPHVAAYINVGWNSADYNALDDSKDTPAGDARLVLSPTPDTSLSLAASYELADSDWWGYTTQERTALSATVNHRLTPRIASVLALGHTLGAYKSDTALGNQQPGDGDDDLTTVRAGVVYRMNHNMDLEFGYQMEDWDSDIRDSFTRNKYTVALRARL